MSNKKRLVEIIAETRNITKIRKSMQYITAMQDEIKEALAAGWNLKDIYVTLNQKYNYDYTYNIFVTSLKRLNIEYNNINYSEVDNQVIEKVINTASLTELQNNTPNINHPAASVTTEQKKITDKSKPSEKKKPKMFSVEHKKFEYSNEKK